MKKFFGIVLAVVLVLSMTGSASALLYNNWEGIITSADGYLVSNGGQSSDFCLKIGHRSHLRCGLTPGLRVDRSELASPEDRRKGMGIKCFLTVSLLLALLVTLTVASPDEEHARLISAPGALWYDTSTGYKWLNPDTFSDMSYLEVQASLASNQFIATETQIKEIFSIYTSQVTNETAVGLWDGWDIKGKAGPVQESYPDSYIRWVEFAWVIQPTEWWVQGTVLDINSQMGGAWVVERCTPPALDL